MPRKRTIFGENSRSQSDAEFIRELPFAVSSGLYPLAIELRGLVADVAQVDSSLICNGTTFDDLEIGVSDSIDELDFTLRLEKVLGYELSSDEREKIPSPDLTRNLDVVVFVEAVCVVAAA